MIKTKTEVQQYSENNDLDIDSLCIDILIYNGTLGTVYLNGFPIIAGATLSITCNNDEINTTKYKLSFNGNTGTVSVIRRKYA